MGSFKNSISKTCPNSIILHKGIYNLKSVWEIQTEALVSNFTNRLNDIGPIGKSTRIKLKDVQILNWKPTNIVKTKTHLDTKGNLQAKVLALSHNMNICYQDNELHNIFEWKGGNYPIKSVLQDHKLYKNSKKQLRENNIMFLDQLVDINNNQLINWQILISLRERSNKERTPKWHSSIQDIVTSEANNTLNSNYINLPWTDSQYKWTNSISEDGRRREWVTILSKTQEISLGKIAQSKTKEKLIIGHYSYKNSQERKFELVPCKRCGLNNLSNGLDKTDPTCKFTVDRKEIRGIKYLNRRK